MKQTALHKDILNEIKKSKSRFLSIIAMIGLGVFVFIGLKVTGPMMRATADKYLRDYQEADVTISSTYGLDETDQQLIQQAEGIEHLEFGYFVDLFTEEDDQLLRLQSKTESISLAEIVAGRLPEQAGEIALDASWQSKGYRIGSQLTLRKDTKQNLSQEDPLKTYSYTVVGFVHSSEYINNISRGQSNKGYGPLDGFGIVTIDNFSMDVFTIARLSYQDTQGMVQTDPSYQATIQQHLLAMQNQLSLRPEQRLASLKDEAYQDIQEGEHEIQDAREELADGVRKLRDGKIELDDGYQEYYRGQQELEDTLAKQWETISAGEIQLTDAKNQLDGSYTKILEEQQKLLAGRLLYQEGLALFLQGKQELEVAGKQLAEGKASIAAGKIQLEAAWSEVADGERQLLQAKEQLANGYITYEAGKLELEAGKTALDQGEQEILLGKEQLTAAREELAIKEKELESELIQIEIGLEAIQTGKTALGQGIMETESQLENLGYTIVSAEDKLAELNYAIALLDQTIQQNNDERNQLDVEKFQLEEAINALTEPVDLQILADLQAQLAHVEEALRSLPSTQELENQKAERLTELGILLSPVEAYHQLLQQRVDLEHKEKQLLDQKQQLLEAQRNLETSWEELAAKEGQLLAAENALATKKTEYNQGLADLESSLQILKAAELEIAGQETLLAQTKEILKIEQATLEEGAVQLAVSEQAYLEGQQELSASQIQLEENNGQLTQGEQLLADGWKLIEEGEESYQQGLLDLEEGKSTLIKEDARARRTLEDAWGALNEARLEYEQGLDEFNDEKAKAELEIADGERELADARDQLEKLKKPRYSIQERADDLMLYQFYDNTRRLDFLSNIFPAFFFLIALLVSLTTMTRMVDEQRSQMGTLKALGYSSSDIVKKFVYFGSSSSLIGGLLGVVLGHFFLSKVIFNAYTFDFILNKLEYRLFPGYSIFALGIGLLCTGFAAYAAVHSSLRENAASLMRPKAPKGGSRIFLEKLTPVWKRLSFLQKVTARNLFRYKKRMMMTIIGVSGCTALVFLGFGIRDSLNGLSQKQYQNILGYSFMALYDRGLDEGSVNQYKELLEKNSDALSSTTITFEQVKAENKQGVSQTVSLMVPLDEPSFRQMVKLQDRQSKTPLPLDKGGAVISEKLARITSTSIGEELIIQDSDNQAYSLLVTGITENYAGHYIYMQPSYYQELFGKTAKDNGDLITYRSGANPEAFINAILAEQGVLTVVNNQSSTIEMEKLMSSLDIVVAVILVCSCTLAIVVLYNLTNINISERIRELSTIKVLGFYSSEVTGYVYRETLILTSLGILLGYMFGRMMHYLVVTELSPDFAMMDPAILPMNYLLSAAITLLFSLMVMAIIHRKLKGIDMVEALKAVE